MIDYQELAGRIERGEIKALSIKQPYPHHIFHDGKDVENRDWPTRGRGWIIVHAGVSKTEIDKDDPKEAAMPRGGVVGIARIIDCVEKMDSRWFFGRYGFVLRNSFPLPLIPCRGALGFFALPPDVLQQVAEAVRNQDPCPYCLPGMRTGLPGNACENCMNTGLKYPERTMALSSQDRA